MKELINKGFVEETKGVFTKGNLIVSVKNNAFTVTIKECDVKTLDLTRVLKLDMWLNTQQQSKYIQGVKTYIDNYCKSNYLAKDFFFENQKKEYTYIRFSLAYLLRKNTNLKLSSIGVHLGQKDHSTIFQNLKMIDKALEGYNNELLEVYEQVKKEIDFIISENVVS